MKAKRIHFTNRAVRRPILLRDPVRRDHHSGAVLAVIAMHKNFLLRIVAKKLQELCYLRIRWIRHSTDGNVHETHAQRFYLPALPCHRTAVPSQIHNSRHAQFFQFRKPLLRRLRAAKQYIAHFSNVVDPCEVQSLRRTHNRDWRNIRVSRRRSGSHLRVRTGTQSAAQQNYSGKRK